MSMEIRDVMGHVAITVGMDATFTAIVATMKRYAVGAVTVIDADRCPVGVVSEDDLLLKEIVPARRGIQVRRTERRKAAGLNAAALMTSPAITVIPHTPVRDAARLMHSKRIKQLPVIHPVTGRITGTVHQSDLLRVFGRPDGDLHAEALAAVRETLTREDIPVSVTVDAGVVTLGGEVPRRSDIAAILDAVRQVDGVIDVVSGLTYREGGVPVPPVY